MFGQIFNLSRGFSPVFNLSNIFYSGTQTMNYAEIDNARRKNRRGKAMKRRLSK